MKKLHAWEERRLAWSHMTQGQNEKVRTTRCTFSTLSPAPIFHIYYYRWHMATFIFPLSVTCVLLPIIYKEKSYQLFVHYARPSEHLTLCERIKKSKSNNSSFSNLTWKTSVYKNNHAHLSGHHKWRLVILTNTKITES